MIGAGVTIPLDHLGGPGSREAWAEVPLHLWRGPKSFYYIHHTRVFLSRKRPSSYIIYAINMISVSTSTIGAVALHLNKRHRWDAVDAYGEILKKP